MSNLCRLNNDTICLGCYVTIGCSKKTHGFMETAVSWGKKPCWRPPFYQRKKRKKQRLSSKCSSDDQKWLFFFPLTNLPASRVSLLLILGHEELEAGLGVSLQKWVGARVSKFINCSVWILTIYLVFIWLSEQLTSQHRIVLVSPILIASPGRIKDSYLLQSELRFSKAYWPH